MKKKPGDRDETVFNTLSEAGARAAYLGCLIAMMGGISTVFVGVFAGRLGLAGAGLALVGCSGMGLLTLKRSGKLTGLDRSLEEVSGGAPAGVGAEPQVEHLVSLLKQWDNLEHKRGSPEFDPWAVQAVRHDIRAAIEQNPALERLFHT